MSTPILSLGTLQFTGDIKKPNDLSAVDVIARGRFAVLASDETNLVQVLGRTADGGYTVRHDLTLNAGVKELDLEGLASDGDTVYAVGSHSAVRKKVDEADADKPAGENRDALKKVPERPEERDCLYRFTVDADGKPAAAESTTLRPFIHEHPLLRQFEAIAGKENGIDIEGLAFHAGELYVGFRGPVVRGGWAVVLRCPFRSPGVRKEDGKLLFVNLGGYGVRDLARAKDRFLILAGPAGEARGTFRLYSWDGKDCLPGTRDGGTRGEVTLIGDVPDADGGKPEGISLLDEKDDHFELLMIYDSIPGGRPTRLRVAKG